VRAALRVGHLGRSSVRYGLALFGESSDDPWRWAAVERLPSARLTLDELNDGFARFAAGEAVRRVVTL